MKTRILIATGAEFDRRALVLMAAMERLGHEVEVLRIDHKEEIRGTRVESVYVDDAPHDDLVSLLSCDRLPPVSAKERRGGKLTQVDQRERRKQDAHRMRTVAKARRR